MFDGIKEWWEWCPLEDKSGECRWWASTEKEARVALKNEVQGLGAQGKRK